jgi:hypothetical protein
MFRRIIWTKDLEKHQYCRDQELVRRSWQSAYALKFHGFECKISLPEYPVSIISGYVDLLQKMYTPAISHKLPKTIAVINPHVLHAIPCINCTAATRLKMLSNVAFVGSDGVWP